MIMMLKHSTSSLNSDIRASNVMIDVDGTAKLADYGFTVLVQLLMKRLKKLPSERPREYWLAPENVKGFEIVDLRSDIWGLGCLVFELLTGNPPFLYETAGDIEELMLLHKQKGN